MKTLDSNSFNDLYKTYNQKLSSMVFRILKDHAATEDVVQETFRKLHVQDFEKIENHTKEWLFTVARNTAIKIYNKRSRFVPLNEDWDEENMCDESPSVLEDMANKELKKQIPKLMKVLTEKQKKAIRFKFYKDYSYEQIGKKLNISTGNVGFQLNFAINAMRKQFEKLNRKFGYV